MISVLSSELARYLPTAQAFVAEVAATPNRLVSDVGLGLGVLFQAWPFQCRAMVAPAPLPVLNSPTVQTFVADVAATPLRITSVTGPAGLGLATRFHFVPFQCRTRVLPVVLVNVSPTAQALRADVAVT